MVKTSYTIFSLFARKHMNETYIKCTSLPVCTVDRISFYVGLNFLAMCALIMAMARWVCTRKKTLLGTGRMGLMLIWQLKF